MRFPLGVAALIVLAALAFAGTATAAVGLNAYKVDDGAKGLAELKRQGFDINEGHRRGRHRDRRHAAEQISKLRGQGESKAKLLRDRRGRTAKRAAAAQAAGGWQVWRPYARTDVRAVRRGRQPDRQLRDAAQGACANRYDKITELVRRSGDTLNGRSALRDAGDEECRQDPRRASSRRCSTRPRSTHASGSPVRRTGARCGCSSTTTASAAPPSAPTASRSRASRRASSRGSWTPASCGSSRSPTRTGTTTRSLPRTGCGARTCATTTATVRSPPSTAST